MSKKSDSLFDREVEWSRDLSADQWMAEVVDRNVLLAGINIGDPEQPKRALKTAFEMNQKGSIPRFEDIGGGEVSASLVYTEQCSKYVTFGFSEVTAKASYGFVSASVKRAREERAAQQKESKTLHTLGQYQFSMVRMTFARGTEPYELKPTRQFLDAIDAALNQPTPSGQYVQLVKVFDEYGHVFPTQVTLGGQLYIEHEETTQSAEEEQQSKVTVEAAVSLKLGQFEGTAGFKDESGEQLQKKSREIASASHFESVGGDALLIQDPVRWVESLRDHRLWRPFRLDTVRPIFELLDDDQQERIKQIFAANLPDPPLLLTRFEGTGTKGDHEVTCTLEVPSGYKIISGGAAVKFVGNDANMLYASYPETNEAGLPVRWTAKSWDCMNPNGGTITIAVIAMYDPDNEWDVKLFQKPTGKQLPAQEARVDILREYHLTGGGAEVVKDETRSYRSAFLVSSYPKTDGSAWIAQTHDHIYEDHHNLMAYAIGIRPNNGRELEVKCFSQESEAKAYPDADAVPAGDEAFVLVGGGAQVHEMPDHHLFASYPLAVGDTERWHAVSWCANSTEHHTPKPSKLTAYAIGIVGAAYLKSSSDAKVI